MNLTVNKDGNVRYLDAGDFDRAWKLAAEHGLVDEYAADIDGEEAALKAVLDAYVGDR